MVSIFFGKTDDDCFEGLSVNLKQNYVMSNHYVFLVPDRMSVLIEKKILENLDIDSVCNIEVMTLSRLSAKLIKDKKVIPKTSSCMILQKILRDNKDKLKCFNKNIDADLAQTLFGTIAQFKSSKVGFEDVIVTNNDKLLEDKLNDIALVYGEYQKCLKDKNLFDSLDRLNFMDEKIRRSEYAGTSCFYVCGFDSLTMQGYEVISSLAKNAKEFNIALPIGNNSLNAHIYNEKYRDNIVNLLSTYKPKMHYTDDFRTGQFKFLQDNLFCFNSNSEKINESKIELFEGKNFEEELLYACSKIKDLIVNNSYSFSDFTLAVPNLESKKNIINEIFQKYNFNYYLDLQEDFSKTVVYRLVNQILDLYQEDYSIKSVISFLKNPLLELTNDSLDDFEDYLIKYGIDDGFGLKQSNVTHCEFYENFNITRNILLSKTEEFFNLVKKSNTFKDYIFALKNIIEKIDLEEKINDYCARFIAKNNLHESRIFGQFFDTLNETLDELESVLGSEICDFKTFSTTLLSGLKSCKISTTPLSIDEIFIGDISNSFFESRKALFIVNACEQEFPNIKEDCGLISDKDIKNLSERYKLEPTIEDLNKKERFKVYQLLLKPSQKLYLSYNYDGKEKSKILEDISKMFIVENGGTFDKLPFITYKDCDVLIKNNSYFVAKNNLTEILRAICDGQKDREQEDDSLFIALKDKLDENYLSNFSYKNEIKLKNNIFFSNNTTSVSQVESFMTCPFLHYVTRGLKLGEKEDGKFQRNFIGSIMHEVAKNVLQKHKLPQDEEFIKNATLDEFDKIIQKDDYESLRYSVENKSLIKNLRNESIRFILALNNQAKNSKFIPSYFEERFGENNRIKSIKLKSNNKEISIVGQVDRIDVCGNYFRIIDYKTGETDSSLKELYFGKKIQLETYLKTVENSLKLKPAGAYYLPVKSGFSDEKSTLQLKYQLKGNTLDNLEVIENSDERFKGDDLTSDIVEVKFKWDSKKENKLASGYSKIKNADDFKNYGDYSLKLIQKACDDINTLDITPRPLMLSSKNFCENCMYSGLCRFDSSFGNVKRKIECDISNENFASKGEKNL